MSLSNVNDIRTHVTITFKVLQFFCSEIFNSKWFLGPWGSVQVFLNCYYYYYFLLLWCLSQIMLVLSCAPIWEFTFLCVEWLLDWVANLYLLFDTDWPRIASYTAAASSISYFRRHTVLNTPNSYFQMFSGMLLVVQGPFCCRDEKIVLH